MGMKLRVYLDTSVFSALFDDRVMERKEATVEFWNRKDEFEISTSELARQELDQTNDSALRLKLKKMLEGCAVHPLNQDMRDLAQHYVASGVFTPVMFNDALHVAAAVFTRQDILPSWNFKHLVNRRRRAMINELNVTRGLPMIEIVAPPEI